jgi:hypothetical protein
LSSSFTGAFTKSAREMIEHATEIRMLAEIRASELLREMEKNKGARSNPNGRGAKIVRSPKETTQPATLSELGVTKDRPHAGSAAKEIAPDF